MRCVGERHASAFRGRLDVKVTSALAMLKKPSSWHRPVLVPPCPTGLSSDLNSAATKLTARLLGLSSLGTRSSSGQTRKTSPSSPLSVPSGWERLRTCSKFSLLPSHQPPPFSHVFGSIAHPTSVTSHQDIVNTTGPYTIRTAQCGNVLRRECNPVTVLEIMARVTSGLLTIATEYGNCGRYVHASFNLIAG
ncbi:uncharacterized protein QC761_0007510 [Podospora bellae-mahoneyi]|uniref:Uncharacterized protein n=1 Tax=Podospora bellae-mahoneyi TaxID=2093777 RepID=A0ABR0FY64_9PEZI|nr:hypothetical protein QC761_0007510 [Podospora bellae-mahoneyi]